jgi:chloramphenicol-sensitive protein RarD
LDIWRWLSFALLWVALAVCTYSAISNGRRLEVAEEPAQA